jgi:acetylornithine deacetylase/succinyl-diaminopimelate desuccinylase-like protein
MRDDAPVTPTALPDDVTGEAIAGWLSRMVQTPSVNPLHAGPSCGVPGERAFAEALAEWFLGLGASSIELDEVLDGRPNVYARFAGRTDRLVVIDAHLDTVTVENMTDPPFDGRIDGGHVWGRGSLDTKASLAVICALIESWQRRGFRPEPELLVVGTVGEEAGGLLGAHAFRSWAQREGLHVDQMVICEPTECHPIHGHKGAVALRIEVHGESAHSSTPHQGRNAIFAAARMITALEEHHAELVAAPPTTAVGTGTLLVSMVNGGVAPNVVPDRCTVLVGRRMAPGEVPQQEFDRIEAIARAACPLPITVEPVLRNAQGEPGSPAFYQDPDSSLIALLADAAGTRPATAPFGTNALRYDGFAREKCVFGPGSIDDAHKATECVEIAELVRTARAYTAWLDPA